MVELTPEERRRIYEEEKARIEAQQRFAQEASAKPQKKPLGFGCFLLILGGIIALALLINEIMKDPYSFPLSRTSRTAPKAAPVVVTPPLNVTTNKYSVNEYGYYEVVGEVINNSSRTFHFVEVKAEFLNLAGVVVGTDTTYACGQDYILPGAKKSFKMMGTNQSDYKRVRVSVDDYSEVR